MAMLARTIVCAALAPVFVLGGGMFLGTSEQHRNMVTAQGDSMNLLQELEAAVGVHHRVSTERRVARLEDALRPIFNALPKDPSGRLSANGVRYMLHRLFVQRHGWFVRGLDHAGQGYNNSSPASMIGHHVGEDAQKVFDRQLETAGFDLHHAAVLAATLENFVHLECMDRLKAAYNVTGLSPDSENVPEEAVTRAMETYMLMYVLDANYTEVSSSWVKAAFKVIDQVYPTWNLTVAFLKEVRRTVLDTDATDEFGASSAPSSKTSWNHTLLVLETVGERYGRWQAQECLELKVALVKMEEPDTGRVPLGRFYASALNNESWQFQESMAYLRSFGALDETDPSLPSVIIPNYLNGPNNCVASSKFYSSCCIDECDALVSHLEERLAAPHAQAYQIINLVQALPSSTVSAPRQLSSFMKQRLAEIAEQHGGIVPLHGRLFGQWMHHAYPRECSYLHLSGTTNPVNPEVFLREVGENVQAERDEMANAVNSMARAIPSGSPEQKHLIQWDSEEELFVGKPRSHPHDGSSILLLIRRFFFIVAGAASIVVVLLQLNPKTLMLAFDGGKCANEKYFV